MLPIEIPHLRLASQQLLHTSKMSVKELVGHMGVLQAQDPLMVKWALGIRLPGITEQEVNLALDKGEIIRTHVLRPTWHLVSADDIHWMLELTAPHIKTAIRSNQAQFELTESIFLKSNEVLQRSLENSQYLTREEISIKLNEANIPTNSNRLPNLLLRAEIDGIICIKGFENSNPSYTLLSAWVPKKADILREEALAKLAKIYFTSHGPATLQDFIWWSGLPVKDARSGLEKIKSELISKQFGDSIFCWSPEISLSSQNSVHLLPGFDEFIIGYANRKASLPTAYKNEVITSNGLFRPTIVENGVVIGTWKRSIKKDHVQIETNFFQKPNPSLLDAVEQNSSAYGHFSGLKIDLKHTY